jgi:predicted CXXCH cytochrome family protein
VLQNFKENSANQEQGTPGNIMHKHMRQIGPAIFLLFVILCPAAAIGAKEQKHSDPARSCVSSECHADVVKHKYLHGPLAVKQCTVCHAPLPGNEHKFKLVEVEAKLCLMCHKRVDISGEMLHDPVKEGKCLGCHDPHGSEEHFQVRISPVAKLCNDCHSKKQDRKPVLSRKYAHKPVADGDCLACHRPHGNKAKNLLDATGSKLCLQQCHEKMRPVTVDGKERKIHLADEDCAKCHRAHDSNYPALLTKPPVELCLDGCHKEIKEYMKASSFRHEAMTKGLGCAECHRAHNSTLSNLLRKPASELCLSCHEELQARIAAAKFIHRPVMDNGCRSCHMPHGSKYSKLLFADYPPDTLSAYDPSKYAFCFSCHSERIVRERYEDKKTEFRNGKLNLHYLHVNKENGGSACRACHDGHASSQPKQIRETVPFGSWEIPIKYTKSNTGGSCLTGCHKEYAYDRVKPLKLNAK